MTGYRNVCDDFSLAPTNGHVGAEFSDQGHETAVLRNILGDRIERCLCVGFVHIETASLRVHTLVVDFSV